MAAMILVVKVTTGSMVSCPATTTTMTTTPAHGGGREGES